MHGKGIERGPCGQDKRYKYIGRASPFSSWYEVVDVMALEINLAGLGEVQRMEVVWLVGAFQMASPPSLYLASRE